ncbi:MAG TPA: EamA family transporter [Phototrophicaceae bacterium]|nr:EamA family transporter [Phototrophicaceae bacterium]
MLEQSIKQSLEQPLEQSQSAPINPLPQLKFTIGGLDLRIVAGIALTVIPWASAFPAIRVGLQAYTPEHLALLRYLTASFVLLMYALATRMPLPDRNHIPRIAALGFVGLTFYNVALNAGEQGISAGAASLIIASAPIFVALLARTFLKERFTVWAWVGIAICVIGVSVIVSGAGEGLRFSPLALLVLAAAFAQSTYTVGQKPLLKRYSPIQFTTYAIWAGTLFLLVFSPGLPAEIAAAPLKSTLAIVYMGIFPGAIGYIAWAYVLSRLPASRAGSFLYLVPAIAILIAWLWLGEVPTLFALLGGALVLTGVIIVNTRGRRTA